jgi:hypothetical protein
MTRGIYFEQVPSKVWQYWPAWQKCQCRELLAWHSQVLALTKPSGQCGNRLNLIAARASCASKHVNTHKRTIMDFFTLPLAA